jgi:transcriptional regulator with XRE-family HTH domain
MVKYLEFGNYLFLLREQANLTFEEAARRLQVSEGELQKFENGEALLAETKIQIFSEVYKVKYDEIHEIWEIERAVR